MIKIDSLSKSYAGFSLNVSLDVPEGHVTGIVGRNGAGKSTIIKAVLGLIHPDSGSVKIFSKDALDMGPEDKERIGTAMADSGFSRYLTIEAVTKILKYSYSGFDEDLFLKLVNEQKLPLRKQIKDFSTGMQAKLRVLIAISHDADLLILDEPTAGLDVIARNEILDLLRSYLAENEHRSILITSHISDDLEGLCDDIYLIHEGRVILHEDTDVLLDDYAVLLLTEDMYNSIDRQYIISEIKSTFGYSCLTNEKRFYSENYPDIVIENAGIDDLIIMMTSEKKRRES